MLSKTGKTILFGLALVFGQALGQSVLDAETPTSTLACGTPAPGTLAFYSLDGSTKDAWNGYDLSPEGLDPAYTSSNCSGKGSRAYAGMDSYADQGLWEGQSFNAAFADQSVYTIEGYFYTGGGKSDLELVSILSAPNSAYSFQRQEYLTWGQDEQGNWTLFWEDSCLSSSGTSLPEEAGGEEDSDIEAIEFPPMAPDTCYDVAVTYDQGSITVYLDGENLGSFTGGCPMPDFDGQGIIFGLGQLSGGASMDSWRVSTAVARTSFPTSDGAACGAPVQGPGGDFAPKGTATATPPGDHLFAVPNPAHNETSLNYTLSQPAQVSLCLSTISGDVVQSVDLGYQPSGAGCVRVSLEHLSPGVYIAVLVTDTGAGAKPAARFKLAVLR
jgi:hypothetical protein